MRLPSTTTLTLFAVLAVVSSWHSARALPSQGRRVGQSDTELLRRALQRRRTESIRAQRVRATTASERASVLRGSGGTRFSQFMPVLGSNPLSSASNMASSLTSKLPSLESGQSQQLAKKAASLLSHKGPPPTWTDVEMCQGCQALMEVVIRSTSAAASVRDIMFAIHAACNNQPEVFNEACMHATHYDANLAVLRQQSSDIMAVCKQGGMCA